MFHLFYKSLSLVVCSYKVPIVYKKKSRDTSRLTLQIKYIHGGEHHPYGPLFKNDNSFYGGGAPTIKSLAFRMMKHSMVGSTNDKVPRFRYTFISQSYHTNFRMSIVLEAYWLIDSRTIFCKVS